MLVRIAKNKGTDQSVIIIINLVIFIIYYIFQLLLDFADYSKILIIKVIFVKREQQTFAFIIF